MITGEAANKNMLTWPLAGSGLLGAVGAFCLPRPLGPEPQRHLPPKHMQYTHVSEQGCLKLVFSLQVKATCCRQTLLYLALPLPALLCYHLLLSTSMG